MSENAQNNTKVVVKKRDPYTAGRMMTKGFEGWRDKTYKDTVGKRTIGYGFNLDEPGISKQIPKEVVMGKRSLGKEEGDAVFNRVYDEAVSVAQKFSGKDTWGKLSEGQKNVLIDMAYNMGSNTFNKFSKMKTNLKAGDYLKAAEELKNSKWYGQVGNRSKNHYLQIQK